MSTFPDSVFVGDEPREEPHAVHLRGSMLRIRRGELQLQPVFLMVLDVVLHPRHQPALVAIELALCSGGHHVVEVYKQSPASEAVSEDGEELTS